jgi:hypothetical protein
MFAWFPNAGPPMLDHAFSHAVVYGTKKVGWEAAHRWKKIKCMVKYSYI